MWRCSRSLVRDGASWRPSFVSWKHSYGNGVAKTSYNLLAKLVILLQGLQLQSGRGYLYCVQNDAPVTLLYHEAVFSSHGNGPVLAWIQKSFICSCISSEGREAGVGRGSGVGVGRNSVLFCLFLFC